MIKTHQRGFTLIELVVVIVILGILAAFAVPRFMGMEGEARAATVKSFGGSLRAAAAMARGKCQAQDCATAVPANQILVDGVAVTMVNGYPSTATIANTVDLTTAGFSPPVTVAGIRRFRKTGGGANCWVGYTQAANANTPPVISYGVGAPALPNFNELLAAACSG